MLFRSHILYQFFEFTQNLKRSHTNNYLPEHSGYSYTTTIKSNSYKPASFVRYDAKYYQMSGNNLINTTNVHYNSDDRVIRYW